ncbi:hypothetical protein ACE1N8_30860 [Streptomyces sp. DSM 116494]|uniref:hypothetical protein n=1 Tax=Streptomyces okerensis TaxID=3344655 RepID=UPI00388F7259
MVQPLGQGDPACLGDYRVVGRLGEGGMGRVFLGRSPSGRSVAIKMEGPFVIGRARYGGRPVDHFPGDIKDVMAFDRALTGAEINGLLRP